MENFTHKECDVLIQALEEWEKVDDMGGMLMRALFSSMVGDDEEAKAEFKKKEQERKFEQEQKRRERKKISARLKARLYEIQDQVMDNEINEVVNSGK